MKIFRGDQPAPKKRGRGRPKKGEEITKQHQIKKNIVAKTFVAQYLIDLNAFKAYRRCGYGTGNDDTDKNEAAKLLNRPYVQQLIAEAQNESAKRANITQDMVLKELALLAFANIKDIATWDGESFQLKPFSELTRDQAAIISSISVTRNRYGDIDLRFITPSSQDKRGALVDVGKHIGMFWEPVKTIDPDEMAKRLRQAQKELMEKTSPK